MKNNTLDDIVKCNVEISNPASSDETFDSILIIVAGPTNKGDKELDKTVKIMTADELIDYGYTDADVAYQAATVAFSQSPSPDGIYVCVRKKEGSDDGEYESLKTTLTRAKAESSFYGIHITEFRDLEDVNAAVQWAEANEKLFCFEYTDYESFPVTNTNYYRSLGIYAGEADGYAAEEQPAENQYLALAWMAKCFGYDPGTETWNLKELATVVPSAIDSQKKKELSEKHVNTFLRYAGSNVTVGGYTLAGEWIDVIRFRDWLKAEMQANVFNVLKLNRKVPFTDAGIGLIEGKMQETLAKGQTLGGIAETEYDSSDNEIPGYTVTVPKASDLTEAERKSRKLTGCRYTARLAGAIHAVEIEGYLTF